MALYLIAFNDEWVPNLTLEELRERATSARSLIEEMTAAGVFVFSDGGLDASTRVAARLSSQTGRSPRPRSTSAVSRSSMCPTMPRRGTGPAGSRSRLAGHRRYTAFRIA